MSARPAASPGRDPRGLPAANGASPGVSQDQKHAVHTAPDFARRGALDEELPAQIRRRIEHTDHRGADKDARPLVTADNLDELVDDLDDLTLDIHERQTKVRVFCE